MATAFECETPDSRNCWEDLGGLSSVGTQTVLPEDRHAFPDIFVGQ
jgi:hypothetical protein